jgi:hypothetical protein
MLSCMATANDQVRSGDGSISQTRDLRYNNFAMSRVNRPDRRRACWSNSSIFPISSSSRTYPLSAAGGRDHWLQQSCVFAGGGIKGGRTIGSTTPDGSATADPGWSRGRPVNPEDIEATIYVAVGIGWTTVRHEDPFVRAASSTCPSPSRPLRSDPWALGLRSARFSIKWFASTGLEGTRIWRNGDCPIQPPIAPYNQ